MSDIPSNTELAFSIASEDQVESLAATALAYRDSSVLVMNKHREQARAVLDALYRAGYVIVAATGPAQ